MWLVSDLLKFPTQKLQIHCYFLLKKFENRKGFTHFSTKITVYLLMRLAFTCIFAYVVGIYLTCIGLKDNVKLTKF